MLLKQYTLEIFKSKCQSDAKGVHCFAQLEQDVSDAIPYLNSVLGGFEYLSDPPAVTFRAQGKLITVHGKKITVNALKDEIEATRIAEGAKCSQDCPQIADNQKKQLNTYMKQFNLNI